MKQTVVERITDSVERFDYYQRGLKQHLGKKNPFDLYERWEILLMLFVLVQLNHPFEDYPRNRPWSRVHLHGHGKSLRK